MGEASTRTAVIQSRQSEPSVSAGWGPRACKVQRAQAQLRGGAEVPRGSEVQPALRLCPAHGGSVGLVSGRGMEDGERVGDESVCGNRRVRALPGKT